MSDIKEFVENIIQQLVDKPEEVHSDVLITA